MKYYFNKLISEVKALIPLTVHTEIACSVDQNNHFTLNSSIIGLLFIMGFLSQYMYSGTSHK